MKTLTQFTLVLAVAAAMAIPASGDIITIDFETDLSQTVVDLDNSLIPLDMLTASNLTADVAEDPNDLLTISVISGSTSDPNGGNINASGAGFGVNSDNSDDNTSRFDVNDSESATLAFNFDVTILSIDLVSFSGDEEFNAGGVNFTAGDATGTVFTFADGGLFLPAGAGFDLSAGGPSGSSVGLEALTIDFVPPTANVPEPTSFALLGLFGLGAVARRRK